MKIKSIKTSYDYKKLKDFKIGDSVVTTDGLKAKVLDIHKEGIQKTFKITLSDGRTFRTAGTHCSTVHFRNSKQRPDKKVYDCVTTNYIKENLDKYLFEIPTDNTFSLSEIDFIQHLEMLPQHEAEPVELKDILPDLEKDSKKVYIEKIEELSEEECWCLSLNDPLGLYLTEQGIFTHNSLLTNLIMSYIITLFCLMREPYKVLGHSPMTVYGLGLSGSTLGKASELLLEPLTQFLEQSPVFEKVGRHDDIIAMNKEDLECKKLYYTTASRTSAMVFQNNLNVKLIQSETKLIGITFIALAASEIGWWADLPDGGWTPEKVKSFMEKGLQRLDNRIGGHYLGRYIIDSSANSLESPVDKQVWEDFIYDPTWKVIEGSRWKWFPKDFPEFMVNGKEVHNWEVGFQIYKGGKDLPPKVMESEIEASQFDPADLVWCPRIQKTSKGTLNFFNIAKGGTNAFLRDYAGIPAGSADRIFQNSSIIENIFSNDLRNLYTSIIADSMDEPEHLIWNKIKDQFFIKFGDKYMFYRDPNSRRAIAIDQSITGDATAISMGHFEYVIDPLTNEAKNVCVIDFVIMIIPKGGRINLESIKSFILDLIDIGNIQIGTVSFDTFQSETTKQALIRRQIPMDYISVDKSNSPYISLIDYINHGRFFAGKNIFLKNNLRSIHWAKRPSGTLKCDHFNGPITNESEDTSWENSQIGTNAKDAADTCASVLTLLLKEEIKYAPITKWEPYKNKGQSSQKRLQDLGLSF